MRAVLERISGRCAFGNGVDEFWDLLVRWREGHFKILEDQLLPWLESEVIKRTNAVVGGGYRSSYVKTAELVVALDELFAETGLRSKGDTWEMIRKEHSRKSAFKKEIMDLL